MARVITVPTAIARAPRLCRWVAVMTPAVSVVLMHHVIGAHTHPGGSGNGPAVMAMPITHVERCCGVTPATVTVIARTAQPGPDGGPMLHPCLAVLTGLVLLAGLSNAQMQQLTASSGPAFDRMFLQMMITHHQGAIDMSRTELAQGSNPAARQLAQQIITAQQAEIREMQTLLQQM